MADHRDDTSHDPSSPSRRDFAGTSPSQFPQRTLPRSPNLSLGSTDDLTAPDAAAALAGVHSPNIDMDPEPSGHRRRRSTLTNALDGNAGRGRDKKTTSPQGSIPEDPKMERPSEDDRSTSEDVEMEDLSDDGLQDDEETGLTGKDKSKRKRRRKRNALLDNRIAADMNITAEEKKEADQNVLKNGIINALLIGLWYLFSLSISLYNKWMFDPDHLDFQFPLFTTCTHMLVQFSLASLVLYFLPQFRPRYDSISNPHNTHSDADIQLHQTESQKPLMTRMFYFTRIGPCGVATGLDIGLGNMSLKFITLTFYTMCKSSSLAFVLAFAFLFRLESPSFRLVAIIATMTAGVIMMVFGEVEFSALGFILVISAAFFSGFRWGLTQILLLRNPATSNPFSSIFYLAPIMFASLFIIAIPVETFPALINGISLLIADKGPILGPALLLFPGVIAFCMTASEFALLQRTSVVTLSIAGIFKEVVTISAAGLLFHDKLTLINLAGLFVTIGAIAAYNWVKIRKMRENALVEVHKGHLKEEVEGESVGTDSEEGSEDWNVTSDGDCLPKAAPGKNGQSSKINGGTSENVRAGGS